MMFEAFGFMQERTLHCRKSTQLPSEGTALVVLIRISDLFFSFSVLETQTDSPTDRQECSYCPRVGAVGEKPGRGSERAKA